MRTILYVLATVAATVLAIAGVPVLGVVAGLALAFVLPGYALTRALFARRELSQVERIVLAPALSLAVLVIGGILLYVARIPLTTPAWALLAGTVAVIAAMTGDRRLSGASIDVAGQARGFGRSVKSTSAVAALVILLLLGGAGWISLHSATAQRDAVAVTQLSMLPANAAGTGQERRLAIDVTTARAPAASYRLSISGPGGYRATFAPDVGRDGEWRHDIGVPASGRVTADLYRDGSTAPFRSVFVNLS